jgi:hypothetical protein
MATKEKVKPMKPFKAWVLVNKENGLFVIDAGAEMIKGNLGILEGERAVRVLVTEVPRGK